MAQYPTSLPSAGSASPTATLAAAGHTALHNTVNDEARAIATKVGTGSSTATSGTVLRGNGAGTSAWAQVNLTSDTTGTLPVQNGGTGVTTASELRQLVLPYVYPVGSIYTNASDSTNPATLLGFGTWTAFGAGKVMVGINSSDADFDTAGETGGAKTHTLTVDEIPSHSHTVFGALNAETGTTRRQLGATTSNDVTSDATGGGQAHNNLQPYVVVYLWQRTA